MAYTILINNDNTVTVSEKQRLMQYSKMVDAIRFIVPKTYNGWEIDRSSFVLQYRTPISHKLEIETLEIVDDNYKNDFLLYVLPVDTKLSAEPGDLEIMVAFKETFMTSEGKVEYRNRTIDPFKITIIPMENWFTLPDPALDTLTQYYLANQQQIKAVADLVGMINDSKIDDLKLNKETKRIIGLCKGEEVGTGVSIDELSKEITFPQEPEAKPR